MDKKRINFEDYLLKPTFKDIYCDKKENLIDHTWLFKNLSWGNHDNSSNRITFNDEIKMYVIDMDGYDSSTSEIMMFKFDNVEIYVTHTFGGNHYFYSFKLGNEKVYQVDSTERLGFSKKDVKKNYLNQLKSKIKGLNHQISTVEETIKLINKL